MAEKTMEELLQALQFADAAYQSAANRASIARSEEIDTRNRLNAAQKAVSARMDTLMKNAPRDSDWGQVRCMRNAVTG